MIREEVKSPRECNLSSNFNMFDAYKGVTTVSNTIFNGSTHSFNELFPAVFVTALIHKNMHVLSKEQYKLVRRYLDQSGNINTMDFDLKDLDTYLGSL